MAEKKPKILIVDDERFYINVLVELLRNDYNTAVAKNGEDALSRASGEPQPDLILLDILMPDTDGYEVCRRLKENPKTQDIPVIFLTVKSEVDDEIKGFEMGAVDYIAKPMSPPIVKARVATHLALAQSQRVLEEDNARLGEWLEERTREIRQTQNVAIYCLASLAETRDNETGNHIHRTQHYVKALSMQLKEHPKFHDVLTDEYIDLLYKSAPLHDIGKVGVPDRILLHPGPLNAEDWVEMKKHSEYGMAVIEKGESAYGSSDFLRLAKEVAYCHHEHWNGHGYPQGLVGEDIPVAGRLMAVADVYDALISKRVYKEAYSHKKAVEMIKADSGTHFDPDVVEAFVLLHEKFQQIARDYPD